MRVQRRHQSHCEKRRPQLRRIRSCRSHDNRHGRVPGRDIGQHEYRQCWLWCPVREYGDKDIQPWPASVRFTLPLHSPKSNTAYSLPHGTCPSVGVGGHGTLGGFGYDSRLWGLLIDTIVQLDVVLADGTAECVSATSNPDLFWALRGAGPGFAIVTTFYFQTLPAPSVTINWSYTYTFSSAYFAATSFQYATNWAQQNAPKELGFGIYIGGNQFVIQGVYPGTRAAFDTLITPLLDEMKTLNEGKTPQSSVEELSWLESLTALAGGPLVTPPGGDNAHDTFVSPSSSPPPPSKQKANVDSTSNQSTLTNPRRSPLPLSKASSTTCTPRPPPPTRNGS